VLRLSRRPVPERHWPNFLRCVLGGKVQPDRGPRNELHELHRWEVLRKRIINSVHELHGRLRGNYRWPNSVHRVLGWLLREQRGFDFVPGVRGRLLLNRHGQHRLLQLR